jgi:hypothetical protein
MNMEAFHAARPDYFRRLLAVLGLLAVLAILIRPLCIALEPLHGESGEQISHASVSEHQDGSGPCCASLEDGSALPPGMTVRSAGNPEAELLAWRAPPGIRPFRAARQLEIHLFPPPRSLPYHARSARILV